MHNAAMKVNRKLLPILLSFDHSCNRQKEIAVRVLISNHSTDKNSRDKCTAGATMSSCICTSVMPKSPLMHDVIRQTSQQPSIHHAVKGIMAQYGTSLPFSHNRFLTSSDSSSLPSRSSSSLGLVHLDSFV